MAKQPTEYSNKETAQRRDDALRRALMTPPKPHNSSDKKIKSPRQKRDASAKLKNA